MYRPDNRNLFSDLYLEKQFAEDFSELVPESRAVFSSLVTLRKQARPDRFGPGKEEQIREEYIDKVLDLLGWQRSGEGRIPGNGRPDYTLFYDAREKDLALSRVGSLDFFRSALCLCEAKPWGTDLHRPGPEGRSPRGQIYGYIEDTHLPWGFVTNGRQWLLVGRVYSRAQQRDLTVDLDALLERGEWSSDFGYFYGLFSGSAFSKNLLDQALQRSRTSGEAVGQALTTNVYSALLTLGQAIYEVRRDYFGDAAKLDQLKSDCLTFLYRLLFVNYAESRKLLPMQESDVYRRSFSFLRVKEAVQRLAPGMHTEEYDRIPIESKDLYRNIRKLFRAIDQGLPLAQIPPYNGGLFRAEDHPLLEAIELDDRTVARVVDLLSRTIADPERFVDYSYLGVRELGSIYEGLLEHKFVLTSEIPVLAPKGPPAVEPLSSANPESRSSLDLSSARSKLQLNLATTGAERKTTGSYYTPDEVVRFIVRSCLAPVVETKLASAGSAPGDRQLAILSIKVLDPAMGSGHFLVAATEYLAERLLILLEEGPNDPSYEKPLNEELESEAKRLVVSHCIYGVDLNPMAVELAKVSLWLTTFSRGRPLSFLDHRLKCGNSLVGSSLLDIAWLPKQRPRNVEAPITQAQGLIKEQLRVLAEIESTIDDSVAQVKKKEQAYLKLTSSADLQRFKVLADLHTGLYFSKPKLSEIQRSYMEIANEVVYADPEKWGRKTSASWVREALQAARAHSAFHWQLEFPDVLVNPSRGPKGAFDVVLGNPPYVRAEVANKAEREYLMENPSYKCLVGRFDLSLPFLEHGIRLTSPKGRFGMIVTSPVLTTNYGAAVRRWMLSEMSLDSVVDFGDLEVFPGVGVRTCIIIVENDPPGPGHVVRVSSPPRVSELGDGQRELPQVIFESAAGSAIRIELDDEKLRVKERVDSQSIPVGQLCYCITGVVAHDPKTHQSKDRLIRNKPENQWYRPYIEAKESEGRYAWIAPTRFIEYRPDIPGHMHRPKFPELFSSKKIFIHGISGDRLVATLDSEGVIANHSMLCCVKAEDILGASGRRNLSEAEQARLKPDPRYDLRYILGLICSRLTSFYYRYFLSSGTGIPPDSIGVLPVKTVDFGSADSEKVRDAVGLLRKHEAEREELRNELIRLPEKTRDRAVHDYISAAVSRIIENNRVVQGERAGFLNWLASEIGADPRALNGRSELEKYDSITWDRFLFLLKKNKKALKVDPSNRAVQEKLEAEFRSSASKIRPLSAMNVTIDSAIDEAIFVVYGLSQADRALIERLTSRSANSVEGHAVRASSS